MLTSTRSSVPVAQEVSRRLAEHRSKPHECHQEAERHGKHLDALLCLRHVNLDRLATGDDPPYL